MTVNRFTALAAFGFFVPLLSLALPEVREAGKDDYNPLRNEPASVREAKLRDERRYYDQYILPTKIIDSIDPGLYSNGSAKPLNVRILTTENLPKASKEELGRGVTVVPEGRSDFRVYFGMDKPERAPWLSSEKEGVGPPTPRKVAAFRASQMESLARQAKYGDGEPALLNRVDQLVFLTYPDLRPSQVAAYRALSYDAARQELTAFPPKAGERTRLGSPGTVVTNAIVRDYMRKSQSVVLLGDPLPPPLPSDAKQLGIGLVAHSPRSANKDLMSITAAAGKGLEGFINQNYVVLNALPNTTGISLLFVLPKMKLSLLDTFAWGTIVREVQKEIGRFAQDRVHTAQRANVLNELRAGQSNVLLLVAHNLEKRIYLPDGSSIGFDEIQSLTRETAPDRAIILVTCEAGGVGAVDPSLAELLLQNRLAKTVFASQQPVKASDVRRILAGLTEGPMRAALFPFDLRQIVSREREADRSHMGA